MKRILTLIAGALSAFAVWAADITSSEARTVAENFVQKDSIGKSVLAGRTVDAVAKRGGFYLVTLKPTGHILVSVNRSAEPIPKFSENDFVEPEAGSPQAAFLAAAEANAIKATGAKYETQWKTLLGEKVLRLTTSSTTTYIAPLLATSWSQGAPYYDFAPVNNGSHEPNGCVGTAYSQIMRYWEWPEKIDEDFSTVHLADSAWGFTQQLWAGTKLNWSTMSSAGFVSEADRLNIGRATMLCGMLAKMGYAINGSGSQNKDVARNPWYTAPNGLDCDGTNAEALKTAIVASLNAKCPILVGIGNPDHSIVCDGCSESGGSFYVHINYGWGGTETDNYTLSYIIGTKSLSSIYHTQRPRPMVQANSMAVESTLPLTLKWAFPKKGYEDDLTGFIIKYAEVDSNVYDWTDDFSNPQGISDGENVAVETISCDNTTPVLNIRNAANQVHYTWPAKVLGADSKLSFRIRSNNAIGMKIVVQAYNPSTGWETICTPTLAEKTVSDWQEIVLPLPQYAEKAIGLRVGAQRVSLQGASGYDDIGVQFDDFKITNVRNVSTPTSINVAKEDRSYEFTSTELSHNKTYVFTVEPKVTDGVTSPAVSTKIVSATPTEASIDAIASVRNTGCQVQQGFYREGYLGLNQFGVYGSEATTGLVVRLSHPVLIDKSTRDFDVVDQKYIYVAGATSVVHAVSVEKVKNGKFLVKLDFGMLTQYVKTTRMVVTFDALDAKGNVARKHFNLLLNNLGGETAITKDQLPDYGGSAPDPEPVYYTVTFNANGGTGGEQRQILSGGTIGYFPSVSWSGHTLDGWYTQASGGQEVATTQTISGNATYYAHWLTDTTPVDPGEDPVDPPSGGDDPIIDPTSGNANDFTEGGKTYRFCNGVNKTSGFFDVHRSGSYNTMPPISYNLIYWWVGRYKAAFGSNPGDYVAPNESNMASSDNGLNIAGYTATLLNSALAMTLPSGTERTKYFSADNVSAASWIGSAQGDSRAVQVGRYVYAALAKGPIGFKAHTSSSKFYCGVIWGCEYALDDTGRYATKLWVTDTRSKNDGINEFTFTNCSNTYGDLPGLKNFNGSGTYGVIEYYYPITGPAGSGGGDDEPTVKTFIVTFDSNGGSTVNAQSVEDGKTLASIPKPTKSGYTFDGWFNGDTQLTTATKITANVTYTAHWTEIVVPPVDPDEPDEPVTPDEPVIPGQKAGGNAVDTGTISTTYGYRLVYNYWLARKLALLEKKKLFILSGASWCSYCTHTKEYLQGLGKDFTDKFVVYYVDRDNLVNSPYFKGGLPQYGSADPRTVNPFAGIYGDGTSGTPDWTKAWYAAGNGLYFGNRGGFSQEQVNYAISTANNGTSVADFVRFEIRGPASVMSGKANTYQLYAIFSDESEMLVDHGVTWSLMSGVGTMTVSTNDGDASTKLAVTSEQAVLRAESTYYFNGSVDFTIKSTQESKIKALTIVTDSLNLEDNRSPVLEATATLDDDSVVAISGVGTWTINSYAKISRSDAELESSQAPNVTVDEFGKLTYDQGYQFEVYDHTLNVTLTANGISVTKDIKVWGPTKVAPASWTLASKTPRLTKYGVVRLKCSQLKYNYGGEIRTTSDTYYGNFRTVMQFAGGSSEYSYLRGLAFMSSRATSGTWTMGLQAQRVNGQYQYWTPENFTSYHSESIQNVAEGRVVCDAAHGLVTEGFFNAYWPTECAGKTTEQLQEFALLDSDGDGFANWQEYILGTDPTDKSDALYLTQGYQHLTAPANDLEAFQYKIMFAQRPGRYYYLYAKENWGDGWTRVAKINYSGMDANQGVQIEIINESKANNGKFFRVGAVLADHEFNALSDAEVIPNLLVAAPDSIIDLTNETLPMNLISFDTDATHAGTVNVVVPTSAQTPGTALISAPKAAKTSLLACKPKDSGDIQFEVIDDPDDATRMILKVKGDAPVVYEAPFTFTISQNVNWSDIEWTDANGNKVKWADLDDALKASEVTISGSGTITVDAGVTVFPTTITAGEDVTLKFDNRWPTGLSTALVKGEWQGTLLIANKTDCTGGNGGCTFAGLGNANSTVAFDGVSGWFDGFGSNTTDRKGTEYGYALRIDAGGLTLNNGSSDKAATFARLTGSGNLSVGKSGNPTMRVVALDASGYTGTMSVVGNAGIIIGNPTDNAANGEVRVEGTALASAGYKIGGSGVMRLTDTDSTQSRNLSARVASTAFADGFTGTLVLGKGRYVYTANCLPSNVKVKVEDGAQLFVNDSVTVANAVTISGNGWGGETTHAVSKAAIRLGNNAVLSGALTVASDAKIGVHTGNSASLNGAVSGSGNLTKWADGTLLLGSVGSGLGGRFTVGQGTVKANASSVNFFGCGSDAKAIIVNSGATFDMNGKHSADLTIELNGGTLTNTASGIDSGKKMIRKIILTADSRLEGSNSYGLIATNYGKAYLDLQGHTLTFAMTSNKDFWLPNVEVTGGTIDIVSGRLYPWKTLTTFAGTVKVSGGEFKVQGPANVNNLVLNGGSVTDSATLTITGRLEVAATSTINRAFTLGEDAKVVLADGVTLTVNTAQRIDAAKFEVPEGMTLKETAGEGTYTYRIIKYVAPFMFIIAENGNWSEMQGTDANGVRFSASELTAAEKAGATITLEATLPFV